MWSEGGLAGSWRDEYMWPKGSQRRASGCHHLARRGALPMAARATATTAVQLHSDAVIQAQCMQLP